MTIPPVASSARGPYPGRSVLLLKYQPDLLRPIIGGLLWTCGLIRAAFKIVLALLGRAPDKRRAIVRIEVSTSNVVRCAAAALLLVALQSTSTPKLATSIVIDGSSEFQTIDGFGVNANAASWNNGELRSALDTLVDQLGATLWRVIIDNTDWELANDNTDPGNFNWSYYNGVYASDKFEALWSTLAHLNQKGITSGIILSLMGPVPDWMGKSQISPAAEDEWVEMIASLVYYARVTRGLQFGMVAPLNEPDWDGIEGPQVAAGQYVRLVRKLSQRLDALDLGDLRVVGPDTASISAGVGTYMTQMMSDPTVMAKVEHFGFHSYSGNTSGADAAIRNSSYPTRNFWMTEVTNIGDALPVLGQNASAYLVWDAYDSVYNHAILAGRGATAPNDVGNGPPLLSYDSISRTYVPRKAFWEHAHVFRFIDPGSRRIAVTTSSHALTLYAFRHTTTGRLTIVGRNTSASSLAIDATLANLPAVFAFEFYQTTPSTNLQKGADVPVASGSFAATVGANSTFTLTTIVGSGPSPPASPAGQRLR
jgi:O-glycosyl hydrolase